MSPSMTQSPRLFWRRIFALIIDLVILKAASFIVLLLAQPLNPGKVVLDAPIGIKYCKPLEETEKLKEYACQLDPTLTLPREYTLCTQSILGQFAHDVLTVSVITSESGNSKTSNRFGITVDSNLDMMLPFDFASAFMVLTPAIFAALTFWFRATPGKMLFGVRIYNSGNKPSLIKLALREYLRFLPLVLYAALQLSILALAQSQDFETLLSEILKLTSNPIYVASFFATYIGSFFYYLIPLARWRGRMFHDKWAGFEGVRRF